MKNLIAIIIWIAAAAAIVGGCWYLYDSVGRIVTGNSQNVGGGYAGVEQYFLTAGAGTATSAGIQNINSTTTARVFLTTTAAASSTITVPFENADELDINMRAIASSSAAALLFTLYTSDNLVDLYPMNIATGSPTTYNQSVMNVGEASYVWPLATSTVPICFANEVCKHIVIPTPGYARYLIVKYGITGANASVWGYATPRRFVPN